MKYLFLTIILCIGMQFGLAQNAVVSEKMLSTSGKYYLEIVYADKDHFVSVSYNNQTMETVFTCWNANLEKMYEKSFKGKPLLNVEKQIYKNRQPSPYTFLYYKSENKTKITCVIPTGPKEEQLEVHNVTEIDSKLNAVGYLLSDDNLNIFLNKVDEYHIYIPNEYIPNQISEGYKAFETARKGKFDIISIKNELPNVPVSTSISYNQTLENQQDMISAQTHIQVDEQIVKNGPYLYHVSAPDQNGNGKITFDMEVPYMFLPIYTPEKFLGGSDENIYKNLSGYVSYYDTKGQFHISGLTYATKKIEDAALGNQTTGFFHVVYNPTTDKVTNVTATIFKDDPFHVLDAPDKLIKKDKWGVIRPVVSKLHQDNSMTIVYEYYFYDYLLIVNYAESGELKWKKLIRKTQLGSSLTLGGTRGLKSNDDNITFFFTDRLSHHPDYKDSKTGQYYANASRSGCGVISYAISANGEVNTQTLIDYSNVKCKPVGNVLFYWNGEPLYTTWMVATPKEFIRMK